jgi:hypothetical protein
MLTAERSAENKKVLVNAVTRIVLMDIHLIEQALAQEQFLFTEHALEQMAKRRLSELDIRQILQAPEAISRVRERDAS